MEYIRRVYFDPGGILRSPSRIRERGHRTAKCGSHTHSLFHNLNRMRRVWVNSVSFIARRTLPRFPFPNNFYYKMGDWLLASCSRCPHCPQASRVLEARVAELLPFRERALRLQGPRKDSRGGGGGGASYRASPPFLGREREGGVGRQGSYCQTKSTDIGHDTSFLNVACNRHPRGYFFFIERFRWRSLGGGMASIRSEVLPHPSRRLWPTIPAMGPLGQGTMALPPPLSDAIILWWGLEDEMLCRRHEVCTATRGSRLSPET